jgi:hypothetical protein
MAKKPPLVIKDDNLPAALKAELAATLQSLAKRYGRNAVSVGIHIENLANVVDMVLRDDLTPETREKAGLFARSTCSAVIRALGEALNVDPDDCFAVANAVQEYSHHAETELIGEADVSPEVADAALAVISKAKAAHAESIGGDRPDDSQQPEQSAGVPMPDLDASPAPSAKDIN